MICYEAFDYISFGSIRKDFAMSHFRVNLPFEDNVAKTLQMGPKKSPKPVEFLVSPVIISTSAILGSRAKS